MSQIKRKWIISAVVYLVLVIVGYAIYSSLSGGGGESHQQHESSIPQEQDEHAGHGQRDSEVIPQIHYDGRLIHISLEDIAGNPVTELKINHEKLIHLIIVSEDLEDYRHLHPTPSGEGTFEYQVELPEGRYKAFVDITPADYNYQVEPIALTVGEPGPAVREGIAPNPILSQEINGVTVSLDLTTQSTKTPIQLTYTIDGAKPEPYLGALGHVVILDQEMNQFIHVHPSSTTETIFETTFSEPGLYKIWGEFQLEGEVYYFPFVIEIE